MRKNEQSSRSLKSIVLAFVLGGATAFALMSHPAPSHAAERPQPTVTVAPSAMDAHPVETVSDKDVCDLQLD